MMRLSTKYLHQQDDNHIVAWATGTKKNGIVSVSGISGTDADVVAELVTIKHLLFKQCVFDREIVSGDGYQLKISAPVIKKLVRGKSSKRHLKHFSDFIVRYLDEIKLDLLSKTDMTLLPSIDEVKEVTKVNVLDKIECGIFDTPCMGRVKISHHSILRYVERDDSGDIKKPAVSLLKRLRHPDIKQLPIPKGVKEHKEFKYGALSTTEFWGHDGSSIYFAISRDIKTQIGTLVTTFHRDIAYVAH